MRDQQHEAHHQEQLLLEQGWQHFKKTLEYLDSDEHINYEQWLENKSAEMQGK